jgi:hypothetical protein
MARTTCAIATATTAPACPIRIVAVQLLSAAGRTARQLFLTADGELSLHPHWLPRELAQVLASNQQLIMGTTARVRVR